MSTDRLDKLEQAVADAAVSQSAGVRRVDDLERRLNAVEQTAISLGQSEAARNLELQDVRQQLDAVVQKLGGGGSGASNP
ncbi:MAG: hypothetical protein AAFV26_09715 [Pseudomonadota bacterium]